MRIVNTMCISKEKAVRHYVDLIVKSFRGKFLNWPAWWWWGACLDQNWMFVDRGEEEGGGPKFRLFCGCNT